MGTASLTAERPLNLRPEVTRRDTGVEEHAPNIIVSLLL